MSALLRTAGWRFWRRHPWQAALAVLGLAIGVAAIVAIDAVRSSAEQAFADANAQLSGDATDVIEAGPGGIGLDDVLALRRIDGVHSVRPLIERSLVRSDGPGTVRLLGIDLFAGDAAVTGLQAEAEGLVALHAQAPAVLCSRGTAERLGLEPGGSLSVNVGGRATALHLAGYLQGDGPGLTGLLVTDLAHAALVVEADASCDRLFLVIRDAAARQTVRDRLGRRGVLAPAGVRSQRHIGMTRAFHVNLRALGLLALAVGVFLIMQISQYLVQRRRQLFGQLRAAGARPRALVVLVLEEVATLAVLGTALGLLGGAWLAGLLLPETARTVQDLYVPIAISQVSVEPGTLLTATGLGIGAALLAAVLPAWRAGHSPMLSVLQRSSQEVEARRTLRILPVVGLLAALGALVTVTWPSDSLMVGFLAMALVLIACAALVPVLLNALTLLAARLPAGLVFLRSALRAIRASLSRTGPAAAALVVAVAASVSVDVMVHSFRTAVGDWLGRSLSADVYIVQPGGLSLAGGEPLDQELVAQITAAPGITRVAFNRVRDLLVDDGPVRLSALGLTVDDLHRFRRVDAGDPVPWERFADGSGVVITESLARRWRIGVGDLVELPTPTGQHTAEVLGVVVGYASERGIVYTHFDAYGRIWQDPRCTGLALHAADRTGATEALADEVRRILGPDALLEVRTKAELRRHSLAIFDQTFAITGILHVLATVVAVVALLASLGVWQLERRREWAVYRAAGLSRARLWRRLLGEVGLLGLITGLLAGPVGVLLAQVLITVVNQRSFGWSFPLRLDPLALLTGLLVAVIAALFAGLVPAWRATRRAPADDLREVA